jgi:hypothetical protein
MNSLKDGGQPISFSTMIIQANGIQIGEVKAMRTLRQFQAHRFALVASAGFFIISVLLLVIVEKPVLDAGLKRDLQKRLNRPQALHAFSSIHCFQNVLDLVVCKPYFDAKRSTKPAIA